MFQRGSGFTRDVAAVVADNLRKAGLTVATRELEVDALRSRTEQKDFDAALYARPDAPVDLEGCFGPDGEENYARLADPELSSMLAALGQESDPEKARETFVRAWRRIDELQPWTFLFYRSETTVASRRLRGFEGCLPNPMECASEWWIPKERQ